MNKDKRFCRQTEYRPPAVTQRPRSDRYKVEYGIPEAVPGANTVEDLSDYLYTNPEPDYRMVSCQFAQSGNIIIVWERI
jgi:hypothetical protein